MAKGTTRRINIYINGKEVENNIKSIRAEMTKLINEQNRMTIGSDEYVAHGKKIREVRAYIQQHNDSLKSATQSWQNLISKILQFGAGFGGFSQMLSTFDQGIASLKKMATDLAAMDDIYSDVIKYTGLTKDEVHDLNAEFKKMNTRTAREELNRLAAEAGKIGLKSKEDLLSFVEAANIIQVSLGEDLGEDAVKQIGKLTKMFGESDKHGLREAMLKVGSTINEVAQNSTAAEPYLLQFTNRLSGIGNQAGLTIAQIVGFGSVLDQNAQALELSSTALDKFIVNLVNDTETVAKAAGVPVKELTELIGTDMNSAILRVFESLNQKGGLVDLAPLFKDLGAEGARAAKIISVLAQKYPDIVREQELATQAYQDGASVLNEYEVKNNNLQAELEKARKRFQDMRLELGEKLYPILVKLTKTSTTGLKLISTFTTAIVENKGAVIALAAPYAAYLSKLILVTTYSKAENLYDKAAISLKSAKKSAILASSVAYNTLAGNTTRAAAAQKLLRAQFASTPWGAILTGLTSVAVGIYKLATNTSIAEKSFKKFNEESAKQESNARMLFTSLQNTTKGSDEYRTVLEKLKELYPDIISSMIDERGELQNIEKAYNLVTEAIRKKIAMQIKDETISEAISDNLKNQKNQIEDIRKRLQKQGFGEEVSQLFIDDIVKAINENKSFDTILKELENKYKGVDIAGHIWGGIAQDISSMVWSSKEMNQTITDTEKIFSSIIGLQKESNDEMKLQQLQRELAAAETKDEKNAIREQIALLQKKKELITTDNNTSTSPGSSPDENTVKKWDTFYKKIEDIRSKYIIKEEFDYSREKQSIKREFESMIKEAEEFAKENPSYAKRIGEIVKELNEKEIEALEKVDEKILKKELEKRNKALEKLKNTEKNLLQMMGETQEKIGENTYNKYAKEFLSASKSWDKIFREIDKNLASYSKKLGEDYDPLKGAGLSPEEFEAYTGLLKKKEEAIELSSEQEIAIIKKAQKEITETLMTDQQKRISVITDEYNERISIALTILSKLKEKDAEANAGQIALVEQQIQELKQNLQDGIKDIERDIPEEGIGAFFHIDWKNIQKDWKKNINLLVEGISDLSTSINSISTSFRQISDNEGIRELNKFKTQQDQKIEILKKRYNEGLISEEVYNAELDKIQQKTEAKEKEIKLEKWRRDKRAATSQAIIQGILAAVLSYTNGGGFPWGLIPMALSVATTGAQIAAIQSEPEPYKYGGFIKYKKYIMAGEAGEEWMASNSLLKDKKTRPLIDALEAYQNGNSSLLNNIFITTPDNETMSQAAASVSSTFASTNTQVINNYYQTISNERDDINERMLSEFIEMKKYLKDPKNRQSSLNRDLLSSFEKDENFLRNAASLKLKKANP